MSLAPRSASTFDSSVPLPFRLSYTGTDECNF